MSVHAKACVIEKDHSDHIMGRQYHGWIVFTTGDATEATLTEGILAVC